MVTVVLVTAVIVGAGEMVVVVVVKLGVLVVVVAIFLSRAKSKRVGVKGEYK